VVGDIGNQGGKAMSKTTPGIINCVKCHREFEVEYWKSLNTELDPSQKNKVLDLSLFTFICPNCNFVHIVEHDFLYHDPKQLIMIYLLHPNQDGKLPFDPSTTPFENRVTKNYKLRIVHTHRELIEKLRIFDANLNDKAIELSKLPISTIYALERNLKSFAGVVFLEVLPEITPPEIAYRVEFESGDDIYLESWASYKTSEEMLNVNLLPVSIYGDWEIVDRNYVFEMGKLMKPKEPIQEKQIILIEFYKESGNAALTALLKIAEKFELNNGILSIGYKSEILKNKARKYQDEIQQKWKHIFKEDTTVKIFLIEKV
jgi:hypothetical protein